jgi:hypothetical protein
MIRVFVKCTESFGVHDNHVDLLVVLVVNFEWGAVDPDAFGARIDCRADFEPFLTV